jgi:DNA-binding NarL/FixJ family response regulator
MRADAECLILEDEPQRLDALCQVITGAGLWPVGARSAAQAISLLEARAGLVPPVMAIVDRDMTKAPDQTRTSTEVLQHLYRHMPECLVIVYSGNIDTVEARAEITRAHPRALLHDKHGAGNQDLLERVRTIVSRSVGDICVRDGQVFHQTAIPCAACEGSDRGVRHWVAVSLVMSYEGAVTLRTETMARAARRFRDWLAEHHSQVELLALGGNKYQLRIIPQRRKAAG